MHHLLTGLLHKRTRRRYIPLFVMVFAGCTSQPNQSTNEPAAVPAPPVTLKHELKLEKFATAALVPTMNAHLIDVGQGLAVLLEFPCGAILVDTGGDENHVQPLVDYLNQFFARRTDLKRTLSAVYCTHPHIDHTRGLRAVVENFVVKRFLDDGHVGSHDSGAPNLRWIRNEISSGHRKILLREVSNEEVAKVTGRKGLTDSDIDPVSCDACDPLIRILAGGRNDNTDGWGDKVFKDPNNNSLVIRVDFGKASILITGDLEDRGIKDLIKYTPRTLLDTDIYVVGHHGSHNATTKPFVAAMTPKIALIGVGKHSDGEEFWADGKIPAPKDTFNTYTYGHPRTVTLDMLQKGMTGLRDKPKDIKAASDWIKVNPPAPQGHGVFTPYKITKQIYGTGWDGSVVVSATLDGGLTVITGAN